MLPSGDPGSEGRPVLAGELGAPVVEAAGGRVGRADLRHGQRDAAVERRDDEPALLVSQLLLPRPVAVGDGQLGGAGRHHKAEYLLLLGLGSHLTGPVALTQY